MKVSKNSIAVKKDEVTPHSMPARLEIAAKILAAWESNINSPFKNRLRENPILALEMADALINEHNRTCGEES